jgi:hypothetical protein
MVVVASEVVAKILRFLPLKMFHLADLRHPTAVGNGSLFKLVVVGETNETNLLPFVIQHFGHLAEKVVANDRLRGDEE